MRNPAKTHIRDRLRGALRDIEQDAHDLIPKQSEGLTDEQVLVWALLTHVVRVFRGIRALLHEGLAHEASVLNRAMLEAATQLAYIMSNSDRLEEMRLRVLHDSLAELESLARFEKELNMPGGDEAIAETERQRQALDDAFNRLDMKRGGLPDVRQMLRQLGKEERYWYFKRASADVHGGVASLGTKMTEQGEGHFIASLQDDDSTALVIGIAAADHFMSAVVAASTILEWTNKDEIRTYRHGADTRLLELGQAAGLRGSPPKPSG